MPATDHRPYVLGHDPHELERLDRQAASLAGPTTTLLTLAGIQPGMHVLDMGTGTGRVATLLARMVGPTGHVTGVDRSPAAIEYARRQAAAAGQDNVDFVQADAAEHVTEAPVDAIVCRLVLGYQLDPVAVLRLWRQVLRPGGLLVAMEYDLENSRSIPPTPVLADALGWITRAFAAVGQPQTLGPRLGHLLRAAGFEDPQVAGAQPYLAPDDPAGPALVSGVVRTLLPAIAAHGIATPDEVDVDTLGARVTAELARHDAVLCPPTLVGGWGYA